MRTLLTIILVVTACGGCASFPKADKFAIKNPFSKKNKEPEPYPTPVKLASTWTPDTLTTPGKRPTRGFGGRVFFYNDKSQPVPVEGDLTVTAYIESNNPTEPSKVRQFGFTAEQLTNHFGQTDLGASYSIWIPWDVDGGPGQRVTLVPSFQSQQMNAPIHGSPTAVLLPGATPDSMMIDRARRTANHAPRVMPDATMHASNNGLQHQNGLQSQNGVQQAGFQNRPSENGQTAPRRTLSTHTIPVDSGFSRNIRR